MQSAMFKQGQDQGLENLLSDLQTKGASLMLIEKLRSRGSMAIAIAVKDTREKLIAKDGVMPATADQLLINKLTQQSKEAPDRLIAINRSLIEARKHDQPGACFKTS